PGMMGGGAGSSHGRSISTGSNSGGGQHYHPQQRLSMYAAGPGGLPMLPTLVSSSSGGSGIGAPTHMPVPQSVAMGMGMSHSRRSSAHASTGGGGGGGADYSRGYAVPRTGSIGNGIPSGSARAMYSQPHRFSRG